MSFHLDFPNNIISFLFAILNWGIVIVLVVRRFLKQQERPAFWRVSLVTLIGLFSFTFSTQIFHTLVKIPVMPLGVWLVYGFTKNQSWKKYRGYAWTGFWVNFIFLTTSLLSSFIFDMVYPSTAPATYISSATHAKMISIHPSAPEAHLREGLEQHLEHFELHFERNLQWYHEMMPEDPSNGKEKFPYMLVGTLPKWGSGLDTVIYLEDDGKGLLITTSDQQTYYRSNESLIEKGGQQNE